MLNASERAHLTSSLFDPGRWAANVNFSPLPHVLAREPDYLVITSTVALGGSADDQGGIHEKTETDAPVASLFAVKAAASVVDALDAQIERVAGKSANASLLFRLQAQTLVTQTREMRPQLPLPTLIVPSHVSANLWVATSPNEVNHE